MKRHRLLFYILSGIFLSGLTGVQCITRVNADDNVIELVSGPIRGTVRDGVRFYPGIPYAAPPVGDLRWKPPQPVEPWTAIRECADFGPICPQPPLPGLQGKESQAASEDCLYLNVWAPLERSAEKRPVMVWIHGGGFVVGSGSSKTYNGANYAKQGVILVTFNYRLGPFGFLAHPLLSEESPRAVSGNYGLLDQIKALQWVKRNIAAFGGDPDRITIFGQSAGAISVGFQTVIPQSRGLFNRAIMESGAPMADQYIIPLATGSMDQALKTGVQLADSLGCSPEKDVLSAMRGKTAEEILAVTPVPPGFAFATEGMMFAPVYDGWLFPEDPEKILARGKQHNVPVIVGTNRDEATLFIQELTVEKYEAWVKRTFGDFAGRIFSGFPVEKKEDLSRKADTLCTLLWFGQPARYYARHMSDLNENTYLYRFTRIAPENKEEKQMGAFHGCELPYVFGHLEEPEGYGEYDSSLSKTIMHYWINFASQGDPNSPGLPEWPAYSRENEIHLEFGNEIITQGDLDKESSDLIEKFRSSTPRIKNNS